MTSRFLVAGHVVQDLLSGDDPSAWRLGGAASYASLMARNLGLRTAVLTAAPPDLPLADLLPGIELHVVESPVCTQMRNVYAADARRQFLPQHATHLGPEHLTPEMREAEVVLLGPVAGEVKPQLAAAFPGALLGAGAQGWLREAGPDDCVRPVSPERWDAAPVLQHARALFLSDEDLPAGHGAEETLDRWSRMVEVLAYTRGYGGADVSWRGERRHIDAFPSQPVDPTGAGDTFAAAFLVRFHETGDAWEATRFAAAAASFAVEATGTQGIPTRDQIDDRLATHPHIQLTPL